MATEMFVETFDNSQYSTRLVPETEVLNWTPAAKTQAQEWHQMLAYWNVDELARLRNHYNLVASKSVD
jgi:hypothetical protein